ncbi:MAG: NAD(+) synthase [candidate division Zixibacteria bacterium]|nr:NAD(+) synthase [candidate division Zixibacteria bacterium]
MKFDRNILRINVEYEIGIIKAFLLSAMKATPKRDGFIVGISGGIDSAVVASLAVAAAGKDNVMGLILPEKESNPISAEYAKKLADNLGIQYKTIDITDTVDSFDAYKNRDKTIKEIFPEYGEDYKFNIFLPQNILEVDRYNYYTLRIDNGHGDKKEKRLSKKQLLAITSAANVKIRSRMMALYYWGEQYNYLIAGTTNKTEFILGDFCKYGDGGTDIEGIAHLYKLQIYQLGLSLGVPKEIIDRTPSPDTFSLPVSDRDFYFCLPFEILDPLLYAWEYKIDIEEVAQELNLAKPQIERIYRDFLSKNISTEHIRCLPKSIERDWSKFQR